MDFDFDNSPGFLIERIAHLIRRSAKSVLADLDLDLTPEEAGILLALETKGRQRVGELALLLIRDATTLTRQIEGLVRKGCVTRETAHGDRRAVVVAITPEGHRRFDLFHPALSGMKSKAREGISESELTTMLGCLRRIRDNLTPD